MIRRDPELHHMNNVVVVVFFCFFLNIDRGQFHFRVQPSNTDVAKVRVSINK